MPIDRYSRSNFIEKNLVNGIKENDLPRNGFSQLLFKRPKTIYVVVDEDIQRPDLISFKNYNRTQFWWLIMKVNGIEDIWNDLEIGQELKIPNSPDIDEYIRKAKN